MWEHQLPALTDAVPRGAQDVQVRLPGMSGDGIEHDRQSEEIAHILQRASHEMVFREMDKKEVLCRPEHVGGRLLTERGSNEPSLYDSRDATSVEKLGEAT